MKVGKHNVHIYVYTCQLPFLLQYELNAKLFKQLQ